MLSVAAKKLKVEADNTNRATDNSSYHAKSEFNNCFIIYSKDIKTFQYSSNIFDKFFMSLSLKNSRDFCRCVVFISSLILKFHKICMQAAEGLMSQLDIRSAILPIQLI